MLSQVRGKVKPLLIEVCGRIADKAPGARIGKTWQFGPGKTLRLVLRKEEWFKLKGLLDVPEGLTNEKAGNIRTAVTLAPERADFRDRWYFKDATPFVRIAKQKFQEDGLLLPFGHPRPGFDTPNPTIFQAAGTWSMGDQSDPMDGWPIWDVHHRQSRVKEDCYGKLFNYLRDTFRTFLDRLVEVNISFEMHGVNVNELTQYLERDKYARIEVSNISDGGYVGIRQTLALLSPLLQLPRQNPHATLIALFLNAIMEMVKSGSGENGIPNRDVLMEYLPAPDFFSTPSGLSPNNAELLRLWDARSLVCNAEEHFQRYRARFKFDQISADLHVSEKMDHTILDKWPMKLRLRPGQEGAKEEFNVLLGSHFTGIERYTEWKRSGQDMTAEARPRIPKSLECLAIRW